MLLTDHLSHSQLKSSEDCPYALFLQKFAGVEPEPNGFAEAGNLAHMLLKAWACGLLPKEELAKEWVERFPKEVTAPFPSYLVAKGFVGKLFEGVLSYFEGFTGFPGYEIVAVEEELQGTIARVPFIGRIDLLLRDQKSGGLVIVDYKTGSLSSFRKNKTEMYRQLLLYAKLVKAEYGEYPERLRFELLKENCFDERPFDMQEFKAACAWAESIVKEMRSRDFSDWMEVRPEYFRCVNLCSCRSECMYGRPENHVKERENVRATAVA